MMNLIATALLPALTMGAAPQGEPDMLSAMRALMAANAVPPALAPAFMPRLAACFEEGVVVTPEMLASLDRVKKIVASSKATVIIQHDARDLDKLPVFPESAK